MYSLSRVALQPHPVGLKANFPSQIAIKQMHGDSSRKSTLLIVLFKEQI